MASFSRVSVCLNKRPGANVFVLIRGKAGGGGVGWTEQAVSRVCLLPIFLPLSPPTSFYPFSLSSSSFQNQAYFKNVLLGSGEMVQLLRWLRLPLFKDLGLISSTHGWLTTFCDASSGLPSPSSGQCRHWAVRWHTDNAQAKHPDTLRKT